MSSMSATGYILVCFFPVEFTSIVNCTCMYLSITAKIICIIGVLWAVGHNVLGIDGDVGGGTNGGSVMVYWLKCVGYQLC